MFSSADIPGVLLEVLSGGGGGGGEKRQYAIVSIVLSFAFVENFRGEAMFWKK